MRNTGAHPRTTALSPEMGCWYCELLVYFSAVAYWGQEEWFVLMNNDICLLMSKDVLGNLNKKHHFLWQLMRADAQLMVWFMDFTWNLNIIRPQKTSIAPFCVLSTMHPYRCPWYQSSRRLFRHSACTSAACQIRNRRRGEMLANITASDISSPLLPLQMNTQSIWQWINNERCRTTTLHGLYWFQPSVTSCLVWWCCRKQGDFLSFFWGNDCKSSMFISFSSLWNM